MTEYMKSNGAGGGGLWEGVNGEGGIKLIKMFYMKYTKIQ